MHAKRMRVLNPLLLLTLVGCMPADEEGVPERCYCERVNEQTGEVTYIACSTRRCLDGRAQYCSADGSAVQDEGPCGPPERTDASLPTDGARLPSGPDLGWPAPDCPVGGGSCRNNTFYPCDPRRPPLKCNADLCVPSGEGPHAGCLAREGYPCQEQHCAPGLVCGAGSRCTKPNGCEDECPTEEQRDCSADGVPRQCQRQTGEAGDCLAWTEQPPCAAGLVCLGPGECVAFCTGWDESCPRGEVCHNSYQGCVSTGASAYAPDLGWCSQTADCLTPGAICGGDELCAPPCANHEQCQVYGNNVCCLPVHDYRVCQIVGAGMCR